MSAKIIQFVPRNVSDGKPMLSHNDAVLERLHGVPANIPPLEQLAHEIIEQITVPTCHDDLQGNSVLHTVTDKNTTI